VSAKSSVPTLIQEDSLEKQYPMFGVCDNLMDGTTDEKKAMLRAHLHKLKEKDEKAREETARMKQEEAEMVEKAKQE
jgi:hypothetical protein